MRPLLLLAAGGLAREVAQACLAQHVVVRGFLDDDRHRWGTELAGTPVLGGVDVAAEHEDCQLVICAGKGSARSAIASRLAALGIGADRFGTVVHPSVAIAASAAIGAGTVLLAGCVLTADVTIGRHVVCMPRVVLTHDDVVADYVTLCAGVTLGGSVTIGTGAYLGMQASVREGQRIGAGSTVGMGSVVLNDVPDGQTWVGVPAREMPAR